MRARTLIGRGAVLVAVTAVAAVAAWGLFLWYPSDLTDLLGVLVALGAVAAGLRVAGRAAAGLVPAYDVAEVTVEGAITRDGGGGVRTGPGGTSADEVVERIERADEDDSVEALLVTLNTPGGEIVPSEDIRLAAERFDGPTVAHATDTCASGGYEVAAGCDELWAREGSIVGSIGVIGSRVNAAGLADRLGVDYEQFTAGRFKDAGTPLKEVDEDERAYLQSLVDDYYDQFVADVVEGRELSEQEVRDTEARVYLGREAADLGLVDELGTREAVEDRLADLVGREAVTVESFDPEPGLTDRIGVGARRVAYAAGAGVADVLAGRGDERYRFEQ